MTSDFLFLHRKLSLVGKKNLRVQSLGETWPEPTSRLSHFSSLKSVFDQLYLHSEIWGKGGFSQVYHYKWLWRGNLRGFLQVKRDGKIKWSEQWKRVITSYGGWALWWILVKPPPLLGVQSRAGALNLVKHFLNTMLMVPIDIYAYDGAITIHVLGWTELSSYALMSKEDTTHCQRIFIFIVKTSKRLWFIKKVVLLISNTFQT